MVGGASGMALRAARAGHGSPHAISACTLPATPACAPRQVRHMLNDKRMAKSLTFRTYQWYKKFMRRSGNKFSMTPGAGSSHYLKMRLLLLRNKTYQDPVWACNSDWPVVYQRHFSFDTATAINMDGCGEVHPPLSPLEDSRQWSNQKYRDSSLREIHTKLLGKHEIVPRIFPFAPRKDREVNLTVSFPKQEGEEELGGITDPYWHSVWFGNGILPAQAQGTPSVRVPSGGLPEGMKFTLVAFSPDYPYRRTPDGGSYLHWAICNIQQSEGEGPSTFDTVVPYQQPLPTEYAGLSRMIFALYPQNQPVELPVGQGSDGSWSHDERRNFVLHSAGRGEEQQGLAALEEAIAFHPMPVGVRFCHNVYDSSVTEFYRDHRLCEPMYTPEFIVKRHPDFGEHERRGTLSRYERPLGAESLPEDFGSSEHQKKRFSLRGSTWGDEPVKIW